MTCPCEGARSTNMMNVADRTPCTSATHSRQGDAQCWARPAVADLVRTEAPPTRHCCVSVMSSVASPAPQRAQTTALHKPRLRHSRLAQVCGGGSLEQTTTWRCPDRSCPPRSRDAATSVADMTAVTSAVALWRQLAWFPVLRVRLPLAVGRDLRDSTRQARISG